MMPNVYVIIGASKEVLILDNTKGITVGDILECWDAQGQLYIITVKDTFGNSVVIDGLLKSKSNKIDKIPPGSIAYNTSSLASFVDRLNYLDGRLNKEIKKIMKNFMVEQYFLPGR